MLHNSRTLPFVAVLKQVASQAGVELVKGACTSWRLTFTILMLETRLRPDPSSLGRSLPGWLSLPSLTALSPCYCSFIPTFSGSMHQAQECTVRVKQELRASGSSREVPTGGSSQGETPTAVAAVTARRSQPSVLLSGYEVPQEALQGAGDQPLSRLERVARWGLSRCALLTAQTAGGPIARYNHVGSCWWYAPVKARMPTAGQASLACRQKSDFLFF